MRLLVVDDNPQDRLLVARALAAEFDGADVVQLADESSLHGALENPQVDGVVTDFRLRWSDGLKILAAVHAVNPDIPVVMFTNTGSEEVAAAGLRQGLADYIIKGPTQYIRVAQALRHAIQRARVKVRESELLGLEQAARRSAEEANRIKDSFLATVSHELRTPLNAIAGWLRTIRSRPDDAALRARGLEILERNTQLLTRLVEDLMDTSRILSGRLALAPRAVDAYQIADTVSRSLQAAADGKNLHMEVTASPRLRCVRADPDRLQQILWNVLSNAVRFTPPGGRVVTRLEEHDPWVVITVIDTGQGIRPEYLPRIFERFSQQDTAVTREYMGLGLGLSLARQLVDAHGGEISAHSDGPGRGATFVVKLPATACTGDAASPVG